MVIRLAVGIAGMIAWTVLTVVPFGPAWFLDHFQGWDAILGWFVVAAPFLALILLEALRRARVSISS